MDTNPNPKGVPSSLPDFEIKDAASFNNVTREPPQYPTKNTGP